MSNDKDYNKPQEQILARKAETALATGVKNSMLATMLNFVKRPIVKFGLFIIAIKPVLKGIYEFIDAYGNMQTAMDILKFFNTGWGTLVLMLLGFGLIVWQLFRQQRREQPGNKTGATAAPNESEKERWRETENALQMSIKMREDELKQYEWLHDIVKHQEKNIEKYVIVERVLLCDMRLTDPIQIPYVEFWLEIYNMSVFDITIHKDKTEGRIKFRLNELLEGKEIIYLERNILASSKVNLNIKQRLSPTEVNLLAPYEKKKGELETLFNLQELRIIISGGIQFPQVNQKRLTLPQRIGINDSIYKDEVSTLDAEVSRLQSEIVKLTEHKLTFEIDTPRSQISVDGHPYEEFNITLNFYIRFENSDIHPLIVRSVNVLLMKRNEDETESAIPLTEQILYTTLMENDEAIQHRWENRNLSINGRELTLYHTIDGYISVSGDFREILDSNCFLRVTMDAMNQPPYSLDFNVKWQNINLGWIPITPRT